MRRDRGKTIIGIAVGGVLFLGVVAGLILWRESGREERMRERLGRYIRRASHRHNVSPYLIKAVIKVESSFQVHARGKAGEMGLMQIKEAVAKDWSRHTGRGYGAKGLLFDPRLNIEIGTWYLGRGLERWREYRHHVVLALAQYNAGPSTVTKWVPESMNADPLEKISYPGTRQYIKKVLTCRKQFREKARNN